MNAVEKSAPAWEYPWQDWCQSHYFQQTGHGTEDRRRSVQKADRDAGADFTLKPKSKLVLHEQNGNSHLIVIINFVSSPFSYREKSRKKLITGSDICEHGTHPKENIRKQGTKDKEVPIIWPKCTKS